MTTAIVFACDEAYFFFARGLVLSLKEHGYPSSDADLTLIDVGCSQQALDWMRAHEVKIVDIPPDLIPAGLLAITKPVQRAQLVRPWLPDLLPHVEEFIWLDCDLWLQNGDVIQLIKAGVRVQPHSVIIAPGESHYNYAFYADMDAFIKMQSTWFVTYPDEFAEKMRGRLHYSTGVFGMRRASPIWALWRDEVQALYPRVVERDPRVLHLAEQTALNAVIFRTNLIVKLDPLYNFHCSAGGALRLSETGRVVTNMLLPARDIGVVHLANWSFLRRFYIENRLLYRGGDYLSREEWAALAG